LNLHGYTERFDKRDQYSASAAIGIMVGVGSTSSQLVDYSSSQTYMTRNAGTSWKLLDPEPHLHEIGDHGSVIILVNDKKPVKEIKYTLDQGRTMMTASFPSDIKHSIRFRYILTEPNGISKRFALFGREEESNQYVGIFVDFLPMWGRECKDEDYELFYPFGENTCVFGRKVSINLSFSFRFYLTFIIL